jgi:hypothetical protein
VGSIDLVHAHTLLLEVASILSFAMFLGWLLRAEYRHLFKPSSIHSVAPEPSYWVIFQPDMMTVTNSLEILAALRQEMNRIERAIAALEVSSLRGGRTPVSNRNGRRMSAEVRRKISLAQKRRWAERRKKKG